MRQKLSGLEETQCRMSEVNLGLGDVIIPVVGALNYMAKTSKGVYTAREALEVHFNRWVLTTVNLGYVAGAIMVGDMLVR